MAERIPNPSDEVRFLAGPLRGCTEGRAPALQAGSPGAVPGDSTNLAVVAPRRSNRSVRDRARFDSVRRLRVDVARRRLSSTNDGKRANDCASNAANPVRFRDSALLQVWLEGRASVCQSDGAGSIPATCSQRRAAPGATRSAKSWSAVQLRGAPPNASARGRGQRLLNAGLRDRHAPEALVRLRPQRPPRNGLSVPPSPSLASLARFARVAFV